jgi:hypothetical protein
MNKNYNLVAENPQSTVVAEYHRHDYCVRDDNSYQSEAELDQVRIC